MDQDRLAFIFKFTDSLSHAQCSCIIRTKTNANTFKRVAVPGRRRRRQPISFVFVFCFSVARRSVVVAAVDSNYWFRKGHNTIGRKRESIKRSERLWSSCIRFIRCVSGEHEFLCSLYFVRIIEKGTFQHRRAIKNRKRRQSESII